MDNKKVQEKQDGSIIENINRQDIPLKAEECEMLLREIFHNSSDLELQSFDTVKGKAMVVFIDGLSNKDLVDRDIIRPLKSEAFEGNIQTAIKTIYKEVSDIPSCVDEILKGNTAVFCDGSKKICISDLKQWEMRSVETPDAEAVTRGPREGFNENYRTNTSLLRRKIRTPDLVFENYTLGRQTKTAVALVYINGIVNKKVLNELRKKLLEIDTDAILESGQIEQYIDKNVFCTVSGIGLTQKPDIAAKKILEGRVAVLCDGTPHVLTIPELFIENIQTADDYYNRPAFTSILRLLRIVGLFISILLPGLSVAVMTFDQEMMPSVFLYNVISSTEKTPLPVGAEMFFLMLMFELLRESGTRLPRTIGSAISIVGALIIGDSAVNAGIVGAPAVIIIALTAVSSFILPNLAEFVIVYKLFFLILGGTMGLIGIGAGIIIMLVQLCSTESFGVPIMSFFEKSDLKDTFIRFPLKNMKYRPLAIAKDNVKRNNIDTDKKENA